MASRFNNFGYPLKPEDSIILNGYELRFLLFRASGSAKMAVRAAKTAERIAQ
jgi:hypothetical protein